ncbi:MAG TPA: GNAT family N-acetyltransferase, partial [Azospirillaceae bacterium]|nr:GNAT family N-acetyltransferase [Azospirillaceae bacterium]
RVVLDEAEILTICVDEVMRRRGLGGALLQAAHNAAAAAGATALYLEAATDNVSALALYRSAGFAEVGRRRGYYRRDAEKIDALVMRLAPISHI